ncbi:hypothetical protein G9C85_09605 [Halorubellus sp. JP-L1]|uniref:DUF7091 family protein n=1 Tax=Halorubellus sp. JP-L1 TaxID=2715753 RepID=UPI001407F4C5|nr:hypothetical protein [Halorubellus sp. JP-L1]
MSDDTDDSVGQFIRKTLRSAGRQYARTRESFATGKQVSKLPRDEHGRARIVCRLHAEKRAVALDENGAPACFDPDRVDCQGCLEDIEDGRIETW